MDRPAAILDEQDLREIADEFVAGTVAIPSDKPVRALGKACGVDDGKVRSVFEERSRALGSETSLFDTMPFSGSGQRRPVALAGFRRPRNDGYRAAMKLPRRVATSRPG